MRPAGLGLDIVEIDRIRRLAGKNPRFLKRVFSDEEIRYCKGKKLAWQHFAVRFAAKEAVWKALARDGMALRDISVVREKSGRPTIRLKGRRPRRPIEISLSHSENYAAAVAMVFREK